MSKRDNHNYEPIDLNKGIALECERDEFGHTTHTLWVDGEVYQITENAWEKLMQFNFDRFEEGKQARQEEMVELVESWKCDLTGDGRCLCDIEIDFVVSAIKGEK